MSNLGRSVLFYTDSNGIRKNVAFGTRKSNQFAPEGTQVSSPYSGFDEAFQKDLWTAQVLALWLTNGEAFKQFHTSEPHMVNIVTRNGYSPDDISPLDLNSNGVARLDLRDVLSNKPRGYNTYEYILGPDGIYGPAAESIVAEWARTNKLFGANVPTGRARLALDRLVQGVTSPEIELAKSMRVVGETTPKQSAADTPPEMLTGSAQTASGIENTKYDNNRQKPPSTETTPPPPPPREVVEVPTPRYTSSINTDLSRIRRSQNYGVDSLIGEQKAAPAHGGHAQSSGKVNFNTLIIAGSVIAVSGVMFLLLRDK